MSLEFTKLSEVATAESTTGSAKLLVEDGGEVKRLPVLAKEMLPQGYPYGERKTIYWDGDTTGKDEVSDVDEPENGDKMYLVSDVVPSDEEMIGAKVTIAQFAEHGGMTFSDVVSEESLVKGEGVSLVRTSGLGFPVATIVRAAGVKDSYGYLYEKPGVYMTPMGGTVTIEYGVTTMSYDFVPDGYPRKENKKVEWDGNAEGLVSANGVSFYKVSEETPSNAELKSAVIITPDGELPIGLFLPELEANGVITEDVAYLEYGAVARKAGVALGDIASFPEPGIYLATDVSAITWDAITPMSEDFLPESVKGGGVTSWNDLTDKPFGEIGGDTFTWDGDISNAVHVDGQFYHVGSASVTENDLNAGGTIVVAGAGEFAFTESDITVYAESGVIEIAPTSDGAKVPWVMFDDGGIIVVYSSSERYVSGITINGYTGFTTTKTLAEEYLPESVKRVVVNVTLGDTITADKTYAEVITAAKSGAYVVGVVDLGFPLSMPMNVCLEDEADGIVEFSTILFEDAESIFAHGIIIHSDNTVEYIVTPIPLT